MAYGFNDDKSKFDLNTILENFGTVETSNIASQAYTIGDCLVYDCKLYLVTSAITEGDSLEEGVNIEETKALVNAEKIYQIPYYHNAPGDSVYGSPKVYIIPSVKLLVLEFRQTVTSIDSNGTLIMQRLPIILGAKGPFYDKAGAFAKITGITSGSTVNTFGYCEIQQSKYEGSPDHDSSTYDSSSSVYVYGYQTINEEVLVESHIVVPYRRLNSYYPMSTATLVTN